jgi:hypothetical protein
MREIRKGDDHELVQGVADVELVPGMATPTAAAEEEEQKKLLKASFIAKTMTVVLTLALLILWPMPMYGSGYVFSQKFFTGWVVVGILWLFLSIFMVGLYPLWEGRKSLRHNVVAIFKDITGKEHPGKHHTSIAVYDGKEESGANTPPVESEKIPVEKTVHTVD